MGDENLTNNENEGTAALFVAAQKKKQAEGKAAVARAWEERKEERLGSGASGGQAVPANQRRARELQPRSRGAWLAGARSQPGALRGPARRARAPAKSPL